jgi:hypothetical protein
MPFTAKFEQNQKYVSGVQSNVVVKYRENTGTYGVEVHKSEHFETLYWKIFHIYRGKLEWVSEDKYASGLAPSISIGNGLENVLIETHVNPKGLQFI